MHSYKIKLKATADIYDGYRQLFDDFFPYMEKELGYNKPVSLIFKSDIENAKEPLGKTACYDPGSHEITIFSTGRHIKDIMRSVAHELVHHAQNCRGEFDSDYETEPGYALKDGHLWDMEKEAYSRGNECFRRWEDTVKMKTLSALSESKINNKLKKKLRKKILLNQLKIHREINNPDTTLSEQASGEEAVADYMQRSARSAAKIPFGRSVFVPTLKPAPKMTKAPPWGVNNIDSEAARKWFIRAKNADFMKGSPRLLHIKDLFGFGSTDIEIPWLSNKAVFFHHGEAEDRSGISIKHLKNPDAYIMSSHFKNLTYGQQFYFLWTAYGEGYPALMQSAGMGVKRATKMAEEAAKAVVKAQQLKAATAARVHNEEAAAAQWLQGGEDTPERRLRAQEYASQARYANLEAEDAAQQQILKAAAAEEKAKLLKKTMMADLATVKASVPQAMSLTFDQLANSIIVKWMLDHNVKAELFQDKAIGEIIGIIGAVPLIGEPFDVFNFMWYMKIYERSKDPWDFFTAYISLVAATVLGDPLKLIRVLKNLSIEGAAKILRITALKLRTALVHAIEWLRHQGRRLMFTVGRWFPEAVRPEVMNNLINSLEQRLIQHDSVRLAKAGTEGGELAAKGIAIFYDEFPAIRALLTDEEHVAQILRSGDFEEGAAGLTNVLGKLFDDLAKTELGRTAATRSGVGDEQLFKKWAEILSGYLVERPAAYIPIQASPSFRVPGAATRAGEELVSVPTRASKAYWKSIGASEEFAEQYAKQNLTELQAQIIQHLNTTFRGDLGTEVFAWFHQASKSGILPQEVVQALLARKPGRYAIPPGAFEVSLDMAGYAAYKPFARHSGTEMGQQLGLKGASLRRFVEKFQELEKLQTTIVHQATQAVLETGVKGRAKSIIIKVNSKGELVNPADVAKGVVDTLALLQKELNTAITNSLASKGYRMKARDLLIEIMAADITKRFNTAFGGGLHGYTSVYNQWDNLINSGLWGPPEVARTALPEFMAKTFGKISPEAIAASHAAKVSAANAAAKASTSAARRSAALRRGPGFTLFGKRGQEAVGDWIDYQKAAAKVDRDAARLARKTARTAPRAAATQASQSAAADFVQQILTKEGADIAETATREMAPILKTGGGALPRSGGLRLAAAGHQAEIATAMEVGDALTRISLRAGKGLTLGVLQKFFIQSPGILLNRLARAMPGAWPKSAIAAKTIGVLLNLYLRVPWSRLLTDEYKDLPPGGAGARQAGSPPAVKFVSPSWMNPEETVQVTLPPNTDDIKVKEFLEGQKGLLRAAEKEIIKNPTEWLERVQLFWEKKRGPGSFDVVMPPHIREYTKELWKIIEAGKDVKEEDLPDGLTVAMAKKTLESRVQDPWKLLEDPLINIHSKEIWDMEAGEMISNPHYDPKSEFLWKARAKDKKQKARAGGGAYMPSPKIEAAEKKLEEAIAGLTDAENTEQSIDRDPEADAKTKKDAAKKKKEAKKAADEAAGALLNLYGAELNAALGDDPVTVSGPEGEGLGQHGDPAGAGSGLGGIGDGISSNDPTRSGFYKQRAVRTLVKQHWPKRKTWLSELGRARVALTLSAASNAARVLNDKSKYLYDEDDIKALLSMKTRAEYLKYLAVLYKKRGLKTSGQMRESKRPSRKYKKIYDKRNNILYEKLIRRYQ